MVGAWKVPVLKKELARADSSQLTSTLYDSGRSKPKNMSGTGEGAEWKFWRIPELVERLLLMVQVHSENGLHLNGMMFINFYISR